MKTYLEIGAVFVDSCETIVDCYVCPIHKDGYPLYGDCTCRTVISMIGLTERKGKDETPVTFGNFGISRGWYDDTLLGGGLVGSTRSISLNLGEQHRPRYETPPTLKGTRNE